MQTVTETTERAAKYLLFRLGTETFGVDVMRVREIVGMQTVTVVTRAAGKEMTARMRADADVKVGRNYTFAFNLDKAVLFDPSTTRRI